MFPQRRSRKWGGRSARFRGDALAVARMVEMAYT